MHLALILFFSMIPPPPTSTLFPYTTLFRSRWVQEFSSILHPADWRYNTIFTILNIFFAFFYTSVVKNAKKDRKSTRLNSSHVAISYAVFCLKKKKKNKCVECSRTRIAHGRR